MAFGALGGGMVLAAVGGSISLFAGIKGGYSGHGLRDFVIGAIVGAIPGLVLGGFSWLSAPGQVNRSFFG